MYGKNVFTDKDSVAESIANILEKKEEKADKDYDGDGKVESGKDEVWGSRLKAAKKAGKMGCDHKCDEAVSAKDAIKDITKTLNDPKELNKNKGEHKKWIGPQKGDYGYPHSAGHGMGSTYGSKKEEVEQIDELSKKTLSGYVKKAVSKVGTNTRLSKDFESDAKRAKKDKMDKQDLANHFRDKAHKRTAGVKLAADKLAREDVELSADLIEKVLTSAEKKKKEEIAKALKSKYGKSSKTYAIATAQAKKVAEDVEQIDELSKKTLANYMRANSKRMADPKNPDSMERKMKRHDDYFKASDKFHKEAAGPTSDYTLNTDFSTEANTTSNPVTPMSRVKEATAKSMKKLKASMGMKTEMLGKLGSDGPIGGSEQNWPANSTVTTDTLRGREKGGNDLDYKKFKVKLMGQLNKGDADSKSPTDDKYEG